MSIQIPANTKLKMQIKKIDSIAKIADLKQQYIQLTTAPLDGMWLSGFVPLADHYELIHDDEVAGYFCLNSEGYLLQFFVKEEFQGSSPQFFELVLHSEFHVKGAFVSTAEPQYLSLCLDQLSKFEVNALMYQRSPENGRTPIAGIELNPVSLEQLSQAVGFAVDNIGAPAEWVTGYYTNLIHRGELFGVWDDDALVATGESRGYDEYQVGYADVGMVVAKSKRGQGLATKILKQLVAMNDVAGLKSICSTESSNIAAQKAIERAGFFASNRIVQFHMA